MLENDLIRNILALLSLVAFFWAAARFLMDWNKDERVYLDEEDSKPKPIAQMDEEDDEEEVEEVDDDLTKIEGIGPKIEELLNDAGISTFSRLGRADHSDLVAILDDAGSKFQMHKVSSKSWARQSRLADKGQWEALKKLQDELTSGR